jgi:chitinase
MAEFAPYVDIALWPTPNLVEIARQTGVKSFNLAFMTAENGNLVQGAWGGYSDYSVTQNFYKQQIDALKAIGGDVILSFGGAYGREIAEVASTVTAAKNAYRLVETILLQKSLPRPMPSRCLTLLSRWELA